MSGPNSEYDPVEVTPLKAEEVEAMRDRALVAVAAAGNLDELKRVRSEHAGDRSPVWSMRTCLSASRSTAPATAASAASRALSTSSALSGVTSTGS